MTERFLYELFESSEPVQAELAPFFGDLPTDPYIEGSFRKRAYSSQ